MKIHSALYSHLRAIFSDKNAGLFHRFHPVFETPSTFPPRWHSTLSLLGSQTSTTSSREIPMTEALLLLVVTRVLS